MSIRIDDIKDPHLRARIEDALGASTRTGENPVAAASDSATRDRVRPSRIRQSSKPLMNKLEMEWYHILKNSYGPDVPVFSQAIRFRLGNGIWYKPDFMVAGAAKFYGYEVKGPHAFRGGYENLKVCANLYREIKWYLVWKQGSEWMEQEVLP